MPILIRPHFVPPILALLTASLILACDEQGATGPDPDPTSQEVTCDWFELDPTAALPIDPVRVGVVPDSFAGLVWAEVRVPGDTVTGYTWLLRDGDGVASLPAPVHPQGDPEGGEVELTVTDGDATCAPVSFTIRPLPEAPGASRALVDSLKAMIEVQATLFGTTPDALADASFDTLSPERFPLAIAQSVVAHAANENSMESIASGVSDRFGSFDGTLADRLIARTGFLEAISTYLAELRAVAAGTSLNGAAGHAGVASVASSSPNGCNRHLTTAEELDLCMRQAAEAAGKLGGATRTLMTELGTATGVAGLVPVPAVRAGAALIGAGGWAAQTYFQGVAGLYPSQLGDLTFDLTQSAFMEDEEGGGQWENAMLSASSTGWGVDKAILEALAQGAGLIGPLKGLSDELADVGLSLDDLLGFVLNDRVNAAIDAASGGSDIIDFPPEQFGPVPVGEERWTESETDVSGVIALTDRITYEPRKHGTGYVILQTVQGTFGNQTARTNRPVEVKQIQISISPDHNTVDPGQTIELSARVSNSAHPEALDVTAALGTIESVTYTGGENFVITYTAPGQPEFRDFITAEHTAETGARAYSQEPRVGQADVYSEARVIVTPFSACVDADSTETFTADVVGIEDQRVDWSVTDGTGSIDASGTFTPDGTGTVRVRATSVAEPTLFEEAMISVGGCTCWWTASVTGLPLSASALVESGSGSYTASETALFAIATAGSTADATTSVGFSPVDAMGEGTPFMAGAFDATILGSYTPHATGVPISFWTTEDMLPAAVLLTEAGLNLVEGSVSGPVLVVPSEDEASHYVGTLKMRFRISPEGQIDASDPTQYFCTVK